MRDIDFGRIPACALALAAAVSAIACGVQGKAERGDGTPPPAPIEYEDDASGVRVDHPEQFPLVVASSHEATASMTVTGVVSPDVSRAIPVVSLASGRAVDVKVRLGDRVEKGQLLLRIHSADVAGAAADYRKAQADAELANTQLDRARDLFDRGAIAKKDLEVAQDAAAKATVDVENTEEHLRVLGVDPAAPSAGGVVNIVAPASGVITEQNVTVSSGVKTIDNSPSLLTISDLSQVWIVCDVYENDLPNVRVGDAAEIRVAAYPQRPISGRIDNIAPILDPTLRTAKVRIEVVNPGILRIGMFVTAVFHGLAPGVRTVVPASAILHLHDREWVYVPAAGGRFQRRAVVSGAMLPGHMQDLVSGVAPGERVVSNALVLQNTVEQ